MDTVEREFELIDNAIALNDPIQLRDDAIAQALNLNQTKPIPGKPLGTYTKALALFAFVDWYNIYNLPHVIDYDQCTLYQTAENQALDGVLNIRIGGFKMGLITVTGLDDEFAISKMMVHLPELANHFYVIIQIEDEANLAQVKGFFNYQQLGQFTSQLDLDDDGYYYGTFDLIQRNTTQLLTYLATLEPTAIALPPVPQEQLDFLESLKTNVKTFVTYLEDYTHMVAQTMTQAIIWPSPQTLLIPSTLDGNSGEPLQSLHDICQKISLKHQIHIPPNETEIYGETLDFPEGPINVHFLGWPSSYGSYNILAIAEANQMGNGAMRLVTSGYCQSEPLALDDDYAYIQVEAEKADRFTIAIEIKGITKRSKPFSCELLEVNSYDD